jgi:hypothetical protein
MQRQVQRFGETNEPMEWARRDNSRLEEDFFSESASEKTAALNEKDAIA